MSDNRQRAAALWNEALCNSEVPGWSWHRMLADALDAAEARARADLMAQVGGPRCWDDTPGCNCGGYAPTTSSAAEHGAAGTASRPDGTESAQDDSAGSDRR